MYSLEGISQLLGTYATSAKEGTSVELAFNRLGETLVTGNPRPAAV
jgi:hypothetical protein